MNVKSRFRNRKRCSFARSLTVKSLTLNAETRVMQLANYGIGGVYNHHTDSAGEEGAQSRGGFTEDILGDRIATAMIYLSDVTAGGATAFPSLGLSIWPKKGDMAFW